MNLTPSSLEITKQNNESLELYLNADRSIYIYNMSSLAKSFAIWTKLLPEIKPYYAIKCNPDKEIIRKLGELGTYFDCASPNEVETILSLNIDSSRIIYANPCKTKTDLLHVNKRNIQTTTFDNIAELEKIVKYSPQMNLIMRIYASDESAQCILSNKYGCHEEDWEEILKRARELNAKLVGISFHIGSGASNPDAYINALAKARKLYNLARYMKEYDFHLSIIDIGGGFTINNIDRMSIAINKGIETYFPDKKLEEFKFIAEPGRYFSENVATFLVKIIGMRERNGAREYYINDSIYGSFNCIMYDHTHIVEPRIIRSTPEKDNEYYEKLPHKISTIYGNTCDGGDIIVKNILLPILNVDDWLLWNNFGAYTISAACDFNGIELTKPNKIYIQ
uniref:ornithine decarboxylase n=1 Tax=viral metagenome TaxID=1070528 RepID=A0A6C0KV45_9ZZZZ